jgi:hypothetical protein
MYSELSPVTCHLSPVTCHLSQLFATERMGLVAHPPHTAPAPINTKRMGLVAHPPHTAPAPLITNVKWNYILDYNER